MSGSITIDISGPVAAITIDNPEHRNAMSLAMYEAVPGAVDEVVREGHVRVVILRGAGDHAFGAGSDISEFRSERVGTRHHHYEAVENAAFDALAAIPMPLIASIHGACMGGGVSLAMAADLRIAADDATFAVPPARLGIGYPPASADRLRAIVGDAAATWLLLTAATIDAEEARRVGLVHDVVAKDQLNAVSDRLAQRIARLAPLSLRAAKAALRGHPDAAALAAACFDSADFLRGIDAFEAGERPTFEGS